MLRGEVRWSRVDPEAEDSHFRRFNRAAAWEALIGPGDALYIPDRWWYWVEALSPAIPISIEVDRAEVFAE